MKFLVAFIAKLLLIQVELNFVREKEFYLEDTVDV